MNTYKFNSHVETTFKKLTNKQTNKQKLELLLILPIFGKSTLKKTKKNHQNEYKPAKFLCVDDAFAENFWIFNHNK